MGVLSQHAARGRAPSREPLLEFLYTRSCLDDGSVLSWVSDEHPGYAYPEAAGFLLSLLIQVEPRLSPRQVQIARWIVDQVSENGAVGRRGVEYLFDTGVVLAALSAYRAAGGELPDPSLVPRMLDFIDACIERRTAVGQGADPLEARWSRSFGGHLLKVALGLSALGGERARGLIERLAHELLPLCKLGRFPARPSETSYVHASCYATEGLMALADGGNAEAAAMLPHCADWLARAQTEAGGLPAWHDGQRPDGPQQADATAQAIRIWIRVDPVRHREQVQRGLFFLAALQHRSGGILYREGSADINTWATIFTLQALDWASAGRPTGTVI